MFWRADNERKRVGGVKFLAEMAEDDAKKAAAEKAEKDLDASQRREYLDAMHAGTVELRRIADELARLQKPK